MARNSTERKGVKKLRNILLGLDFRIEKRGDAESVYLGDDKKKGKKKTMVCARGRHQSVLHKQPDAAHELFQREKGKLREENGSSGRCRRRRKYTNL